MERRPVAILTAVLLLVSCVDGARVRSKASVSTHPIENVIQLLNDLQAKVKEQLGDEEITWAKFETWSKTSSKSLKKAIAEEEERKTSLEETIAGEEAAIESLTAQIESLTSKVAQLEQRETKAEEQRDAGRAEYKEDVKLYKGDIKAMISVEEELEKGQAAQAAFSLFQRALRSNKAAPKEVKVESHLDGTTEVFEELEHDFADKLKSTHANETNAINAFELEQAARGSALQAAELELSDCETKKGNTETSLGDNKADLAQVTTDLKDNKDTLAEVEADFRSQSDAYNLRRSTQEGEIEAVTQAVKIMSKVTHVDAPPSFIQMADPRTKAVQLLRDTARTTKSTALQRLAQQVSVSKGPFDQINNMIQKMIFRLQSEQKDEDDHKNWCDLELEKTNTSKTHSTETIETLSGELDVLAAKIADLTRERDEKVSNIADYTTQMKDLTDIRAEDKAENERIIKESQEAQNAVSQAIAVLEDFYKSSGAVQTEFVQGPVVLGDKPSTWDSSYTGAADPKNPQDGILAILERVSADYSSVEADTKAAETGDQNRYDNEMQELKINKARAEAEVKQLGARIRRKQDAEASTKGKHEKRSTQLKAEEQYWNDLQKACVDGDSSYEDRKNNRQLEITGLEDALTILKDAFKL